MERTPELFDPIAARYDRWSAVLSAAGINAWHHAALRALDLKQGLHVLDVGAGTGIVTRRVATLVGRTGRVVGLDPSPGMLRAAALEPIPDSAARIEWVDGMGEHLPFDDATFDRVTAQFSLRNMDDWHEGLREMVRVTRPGGRVVVLDLVQPVTTAGALAMRGLETATHALKLQALTPYLWLGRSLMHAPTEEEVEEALVELQLSLRIRHRWLGDLVLLLSAERSGTPVFLPAGSVPDRVRQRVMWATDGSASAMAAGEWLAAFLPAGAAVDLVAVCPPYYGGDRPILEGPDHRAWEHALKVAEAALPDRVRIERHLVEGEPGPALLALGQRLHPTLMVLGMKHRHVGANRLMGSVLQYLLARATWPVLAVPVETALVHQPGSQKAALTDGYPASP